MLDQQFSVVQAATSSVGSDQTTKALLARKLNELIDHRGLNQAAVADITGMTQPKVSQVRRGQFHNISLERLMQALVALDQRVEIVVRPTLREETSGITVVQ
jgi:predicted XRE-type DNA-binding protein